MMTRDLNKEHAIRVRYADRIHDLRARLKRVTDERDRWYSHWDPAIRKDDFAHRATCPAEVDNATLKEALDQADVLVERVVLDDAQMRLGSWIMTAANDYRRLRSPARAALAKASGEPVIIRLSEDITLNDWRDAVSAWCERKGWREDMTSSRPNSAGDLLMLVVTELAEALEEVRDHRGLNEIYYATDKQGRQKPEGVPVELADVLIRVFDMAGRWGIDLNAIVAEKMAYNEGRPYKHGGRSI